MCVFETERGGGKEGKGLVFLNDLLNDPEKRK